MALDVAKLTLALHETMPSMARDVEQRHQLSAQLANLYQSAQLVDFQRLQAVAPPYAIPIEPLDFTAKILPLTLPHTIIATDGSQIAPNAHECPNCALINTGRVAIDYGGHCLPLLDSIPEVLFPFTPEAQDPPVSVKSWLALHRDLAELSHLVNLATDWNSPTQPRVALVDGSLIPWGLAPLTESQRLSWQIQILEALKTLKGDRIPIAGYISATQSREILRSLTQQVSSSSGNDPNPFTAAVDADFWRSHLSIGERSNLWRSQLLLADLNTVSEKVNQAFQDSYDDAIYFCYLRLASDIVRLEFPGWVISDSQLLEMTLGAIASQIQRGDNYPLALAEAHHLAVLKNGDRRIFFDTLQTTLQASTGEVQRSPKAQQKRVASS